MQLKVELESSNVVDKNSNEQDVLTVQPQAQPCASSVENTSTTHGHFDRGGKIDNLL
jgi:hypothetical protein